MYTLDSGDARLDLSIGGYPGPWIRVFLSPKGQLLHILQIADKITTETNVIPSPSAWGRFYRSCKRIGVAHWLPQYTTQHQCSDGTHWDFNLKIGDVAYKGEGVNAYPLGFDVFLSSVERLLGGQPFA